MPGEATRAIRDYLKALHDEGGCEERVPARVVAKKLNLNAGYVAATMRRLAAAGWLDYEPGVGARLIGNGLAEAKRPARRVRLLERFLEQSLGLDPSTARAEAEALAQVTSSRLEHALAEYLGDTPAGGDALGGR